MMRLAPRSPLVPYTTLFRSRADPRPPARGEGGREVRFELDSDQRDFAEALDRLLTGADTVKAARAWADGDHEPDRKSTRLNSSHANISYAVFCLIKTTSKVL